MRYKEGIYKPDEECGQFLDHAVLLVGQDVVDNQNIYIIKNSWGTVWGELGYVRMLMGTGSGTCGIANKDGSIAIA